MRALLVVTVVAALGCVVPKPAPPLVGDGTTVLPQPGTAGPPIDFSLRRFPDNALYRLSSDRGSVVLVDVWATWCEPCRESLPLYEDLLKQFGPRGFKVYAVSVDGDEGEIPRFIAETKLTLPVLLDPEARYVEPNLKVKMMPTSFLVDKRGVVRAVHEGLTDDMLQKYLLEIEGLLSEPYP